jgi:hypothetical protein
MTEKEAYKATPIGGVEPAGKSPAVSVVPEKERPTFICEFCGPQKPAEEVFQCTLCMHKYCVTHLNPMAHYCFGALGKAQSIGVSS